MRTYSIVLDPNPEQGGFTVTVPALPGCITQGDSVDQCIERAQEAVALYLEDLTSSGKAIPEESEPPQVLQITVGS